MARVIRTIHRDFMHPIGQAVALSFTINHRLWTRDFGIAWESLRLDEKVIWLAVISNTICVFTLLELLFFKR